MPRIVALLAGLGVGALLSLPFVAVAGMGQPCAGPETVGAFAQTFQWSSGHYKSCLPVADTVYAQPLYVVGAFVAAKIKARRNCTVNGHSYSIGIYSVSGSTATRIAWTGVQATDGIVAPFSVALVQPHELVTGTYLIAYTADYSAAYLKGNTWASTPTQGLWGTAAASTGGALPATFAYPLTDSYSCQPLFVVHP